ncbi:MAG: cation acetate symporter, partial [Gammaproteobacteria bacterium]
GMLSGLLFTLVYIFVYKGWFFIPDTNWYPDNAANWFMGISPLSIGAIGAVLNFSVAYAVSHVTAPPPQKIIELVERIRTPYGAGAALSK